jgi:hypothetical protein
MSDQLNRDLDKLKQLIVEIRQQFEVAELKVDSATSVLTRLAETKLSNEDIFLGDVILCRPYDVSCEETGTGQVVQAALAIPGGFGCIFWDSEEYAALDDNPQLESEAMLRLRPFAQCSPAVKALLLPQLLPLMDKLLCALGRI